MRIVDLETKRHDDRLETIKQQGELDEFTERRLALAGGNRTGCCTYLHAPQPVGGPERREGEEAEHIGVPVQALERRSVDLLVLCVTFLKLSVYRENKDAMKQCAVVDKLARFVPGQDVLLLATLRLLLNLSFGETCENPWWRGR